MSYAPPSGSGINFLDGGVSYSAPSGNAVYFQWVDTYVVTVSGSSLASFSGLVDRQGSFAAQGASTPYFEHPYRNFAIGAGSNSAFYTWLRAISIQGSSALVARHGFRFSAASVSSPSIQVFGLFPAATSVYSGSVFSASARWIHYATAAIKPEGANAKFAGAFNRDFAFVVRGKAVFDPAPRFTKSAAFSGAAQSDPGFAASWGIRSAFGIAAGGALAGMIRAISPAGFSVTTGSATSLVGQESRAGGFSSSAYANTSFSGAYDYSPLSQLPDEYDVAYVRTVRQAVAVFH